MRWLNLLAVAGAVIVASTEAMADFGPQQGNCPNAAGCYELSGDISELDALAVRTMVEDLQRRKVSRPYVMLNSRGGDVDAALSIGRDLRKVRAIATMGEMHICYSSCVFVLSGATQRAVGGSVGIHRPYSERTGLIDVDQAQREYTRLTQTAKRFLAEMNLPGELYEAMVRIPPEEIRVLNSFELSAFGLNTPDPVEQDFFDSIGAKQYNLTKQEYLSRKAREKQTCGAVLQTGDVDAYNACVDRVMRTGQ